MFRIIQSVGFASAVLIASLFLCILLPPSTAVSDPSSAMEIGLTAIGGAAAFQDITLYNPSTIESITATCDHGAVIEIDGHSPLPGHLVPPNTGILLTYQALFLEAGVVTTTVTPKLPVGTSMRVTVKPTTTTSFTGCAILIVLSLT